MPKAIISPVVTRLKAMAAVAVIPAILFVSLSSMVASAGEKVQNAPADFSGVWEPAAFDLVIRPENNNPQYTDEAGANVKNYDEKYDLVQDDPAKFCGIKGMPWTMLSRARDYPMEIYQTQDRIVMFFEYADQTRNIRLDMDQIPTTIPRSAQGFSIAHWDGKNLIVETANLTARHPINPFQRSEAAKITERWTLAQDKEFGEVLKVDITFEDPEIFTTPAKASQVYKRVSDGILPGGYNCADELWNEYIEQRQEEVENESKNQE